jgi:hypothetical protein
MPDPSDRKAIAATWFRLCPKTRPRQIAAPKKKNHLKGDGVEEDGISRRTLRRELKLFTFITQIDKPASMPKS